MATGKTLGRAVFAILILFFLDKQKYVYYIKGSRDGCKESILQKTIHIQWPKYQQAQPHQKLKSKSSPSPPKKKMQINSYLCGVYVMFLLLKNQMHSPYLFSPKARSHDWDGG